MITITKNGSDISAQVIPASLSVTQKLTNEPDTAQFSISLVSGRTTPVFNDDIVIYDGASKIFAGKVVDTKETMTSAKIPTVLIQCVDHTFQFDRVLAAKTYTNQTIQAIIADLVASYATGFTTTHAVSTFVVEKIVFNQVPLSQCMKRLADIVRFDWYIDEDKDVHFFEKFTNSAPFDLTDTDGNHIYTSLARAQDGSQLVNRVKVRGGLYNGTLYTDVIPATGSATAFFLPYQMANLTIEVDSGSGYVSQRVGVDFIDTFGGAGTPIAVLYNFATQSFRFGTPFGAAVKIRYTGNPKVQVLAIAEDSASVGTYGAIEKVVQDAAIASNAVARQRAAAELLAFGEIVVDATFTTYVAGLRTGMLLRVSSTARGFDDDLIIKTVTFQARTNTTYQYRVECISTYRYNFLDLLRKIITPDPKPSDEQEVSEQIYAINEEIVATDLWTNVAANSINETIVGTDTWLSFAGATVHWVYGYYAPTSISDVNRMGRYDRGATYQ